MKRGCAGNSAGTQLRTQKEEEEEETQVQGVVHPSECVLSVLT